MPTNVTIADIIAYHLAEGDKALQLSYHRRDKAVRSGLLAKSEWHYAAAAALSSISSIRKEPT